MEDRPSRIESIREEMEREDVLHTHRVTLLCARALKEVGVSFDEHHPAHGHLRQMVDAYLSQ